MLFSDFFFVEFCIPVRRPVNGFFELRLIEPFTLSASSFFILFHRNGWLKGVCGRNFLVTFCNELRFLDHPTNRLIKLIGFDRTFYKKLLQSIYIEIQSIGLTKFFKQIPATDHQCLLTFRQIIFFGEHSPCRTMKSFSIIDCTSH